MCVRVCVCVCAACACLVQAAPPHVEQRLAVVPQLLECELTHAAEDPVGAAARPHGVQQILREAEGHTLRRLEVEAVIEEASKVDVHHLVRGGWERVARGEGVMRVVRGGCKGL